MQDKKEILTMEQLHEIVNDYIIENENIVQPETKQIFLKILNDEEIVFIEIDGIYIRSKKTDKVIDFKKELYSRVTVMRTQIFNSLIELVSKFFNQPIEIQKELASQNNGIHFNGNAYVLRLELNDALVELPINKRLEDAIIQMTPTLDSYIEKIIIENFYKPKGLKSIDSFLNYYAEGILKNTIKFCKVNNIENEVKEKLLKIGKVHFDLTIKIIERTRTTAINDSHFVEIVKDLKKFYRKQFGIRPRAENFKDYLQTNILKVDDLHLEKVLEKHLDKFIIDKKNQRLKSLKEIESKRLQTIDRTPKQTLSIESSHQVEGSEPKGILVLSQREIALIYHYEGWILTDENSNNEVSKYLKKDGTRHQSGKALIADYRIVHSKLKDWLNQKTTIQNLEKIIPLLQNTSGIKDAKGDLEQAVKNRESFF